MATQELTAVNYARRWVGQPATQSLPGAGSLRNAQKPSCARETGLKGMERVKGNEPSSSAWKAGFPGMLLIRIVGHSGKRVSSTLACKAEWPDVLPRPWR